MVNIKCNWLKIFDNFALVINFQINKDDSYKSRCGGFSFLIFLIISLVYIGDTFIDFAARKNFSILYTNKMIAQGPVLNLTHAEFKMAFGLFFLSNYSTALESFKEYLELNLYFYVYTDNKDHEYAIPIKQCTYEDFDFISKEYFDFNTIADMICPNLTGQNYTIAGFWTDIYSRNIFATVKIKDKYLQQTEKVREILETDQLYMITLFKDIAIDYDIVDRPITGYLNSMQIYLDFNLTILNTVGLSNIQFESDSNIIYSDPSSVTNVTSDSVETRQFYRSNRNSNVYLNNLLAQFDFIASNKMNLITRSYQKFPSYLADTSGLLSQGLFLLFIVMTYFNQKQLASKLLENTLKYRGNNQFDAEFLTSTFKLKCGLIAPVRAAGSCNSPEKSNIALKNNEAEATNLAPLEMRQNIRRKSTLLSSTLEVHNMEASLKKKSKKGFWKCWKKVDLKVDEKRIGEERIGYFLNIFTYMRKIQEIDILKYLFLTKEQLNLVNFLSKPTLNVNGHKSDLYKEYIFEQKMSNKLKREECDQIIQSYQALAAWENHSMIEEKLMVLFETEIELLNKK